MNSLNAISPIDGRYSHLTTKLNNYFSESSLIKYRINIEINYFLELCKIIPSLKKISKSKKKEIELISKKISINDSNTLHYKPSLSILSCLIKYEKKKNKIEDFNINSVWEKKLITKI